MGTLSEEIALSMLRSSQLAKLDVQAQWETDLQSRLDKPPTWSWTPGTFVFPEGLCCYCGAIMQSPAIWRSKDLQFFGSWKVVEDSSGQGHFAFEESHPHVYKGSICMGDAYRAATPAEALFLAFNPTSSYFGGDTGPVGSQNLGVNERIKLWFADRFNHVCGQSGGPAAMAGLDIRHLVAPEDGCHCHYCRMHRGEVHCRRCEELYSPRRGHGPFRCRDCGSNYCTEHFHDGHTCSECGDYFDLWDMNTGEIVAEPEIAECACGEWVCKVCREEGEHSDCTVDEDTHVCCSDCAVCCECGAERDTEF